ncbi:cytochrome d ubiquinol oxidase subunit II [Chromobacterium subtsugae]|uniref:Cytochrome d ubiquinol oxidase subunit II n=1 Tax=Chromobacterium subtsugae TaxID=251747 RepID=A0ABS7FDU9_9NEIS|nr:MULTISPECIES: cytochrome d ubiquinol oxidase subunit II [Chromobacterium]KUM03640.1 cytochrome BD ubiquinol oxidase subunit II [Chromobacterium subtsugae]KZE86900.1 cytochrome BD ubiquinol oxidase subunit II [Chromobacterium sp. F49]MBW7566841.1 cytochrome d ubiquinol oxidase subunit II [Chromobacterium subtsugae]MBW8288146.1 cytochrome d ubiquinol oxidase subunit II [Chromobacterium subtsugae]OBU86560.1 cytochrome BD ubiquinol oxidase subunit II [Chromobacterium subtsugae]
MNEAYFLPAIFAGLMALSMLVYVVLDGFDLGVGILLPLADDEEKDLMIASIGPFWDANETWLVLGAGLLLVAFPLAHGVVFGALYLPVLAMLVGLILRGVAFDFRVKAQDPHKPWWNAAFAGGSLLAALAQGVMLGRYLTGFADSSTSWLFSLVVGVGLALAYALLGACWLVMKTHGTLQAKAIRWAQLSLYGAGAAVAAVSLVTPLANPAIAAKWFALPQFLLLLPLPLGSLALFGLLMLSLPRLARRQAAGNDAFCWLPFAASVGIVLLSFWGLAYSVFPEVVLGQMTIWQAAADPEALWVILWGAIVVLPCIIGYTAFAYRVFWGKADKLSYQ